MNSLLRSPVEVREPAAASLGFYSSPYTLTPPPPMTADVASLFNTSLAAQRPSNLSFHWESPAELRSNWEAYGRARADCSWKPSADPVLMDVESSQDEYNEHLLRYVPFPWCDPMCTFNRPRGESRVCTVPADEAHSSWHIQRIGPIVSRGGNNFIVIRAADALDLSQALSEHADGLWVRSIFLAAVDDVTGAIVEYPPIHIHHSHLGPHSMIGILDYVAPLHFPHGETSCLEADGGAACYMFSFPRGDGFHVHSSAWPLHAPCPHMSKTLTHAHCPLHINLARRLAHSHTPRRFPLRPDVRFGSPRRR